MATIANVDQAKAWDGNEGAHWAAHADRYDSAVAVHHAALLDAAAVRDGERVLDVGCGCGQSTIDAARRAGSGSALGVDLSHAMLGIAAARARDAGVANVSFLPADAQVHEFEPDEFDVVISRFGAMFFADLPAAFANIGRAVAPRGRLAIVSWSTLDHNEWLVEVRAALAVGRDLPAPPPGAPGPFGLGDPDRTRAWFEAAGFTDVDLVEVRAPFVVGADADDAFEFMRETGAVIGMTESLDDDAHAAAFDALRTTMKWHETAEGVTFGSSVWVITATKT